MAFFSCLKCFQKEEDEEITQLDYAHHSLNDVPNEVFVYERTLEQLVLDCNNIRDLPRQLFHCEGLKSLSVADNDVHVIPPALSSLTSLTFLNVSKNVLTDIPDTIKQCKQLAILDASVNPLQKIPEGCTQLLSITELYLNDTFLEFLPANFGRLSKLKILELRENGLNTLPKSLNRLTSLERLDLGQNEISEVPEVIGALQSLKELWLDGNKIKSVPDIIGNLRQLVHLDFSVNRIDYVSDTIQYCTLLNDLSFSTNDLKNLPEAIGGLDALVTLKLDDNRLREIPLSIGKLKCLEELVISQNYLEVLPPSIGLCRKLHTLNMDDNDIEYLPKELGSCRSLRILSCHGNRLTTLPAEIDHLKELAVINLTANMIQHLPVSLMKLNNVSAIWLSENQHKPLVQLNQDTDPETGQRVLTNFLLPQQNQDNDYDFDKKSESGSFHALAWEEERSRRSQVKWAGDYSHPEAAPPSQSSLRREPTPFPKEMRAMAKRVQNLRSKKINDAPADDLIKKKRRASVELSGGETQDDEQVDSSVAMAAQQPKLSVSDVPSIEVKEAKVFNLPSPTTEEKDLRQFEELEKAIIMNENISPTDKTSRDSGVSDGSSPDQEPISSSSNGSSRNPSDPLPQAPVKAEIVTNEIEPELENNGNNRVSKPPPYHIAAQMSRHANDFQLERKSSFMSDVTMDSISGSETSTAPSSLQTIVRGAAEASQNSETESVYNHANNLRKVSEKMLLGGNSNPTRNSRSSMTGIPRLNTKPLINNIAGSEMRPSSYAGPHHTIGLPVMSPSARMNTTLPLPSSNTSTLERTPAKNKSPPPAIPVLNMRPANNGLLTTIEQAAMSDEEPTTPVEKKPPSRIPTPLHISNNQPNYENVNRLNNESPSMIPIPKKTSDRISTANFVVNSPARKPSVDFASTKRTSKIPVPGSH